MIKRAEAAAETAAKEAEYEMLQKERILKEKIQLLKEKPKRDLDAQKDELERLQAEKEIKAARVRLEVYNQEASIQSVDNTKCLSHHVKQEPVYLSSVKSTLERKKSSPLNRLPIPEPTVFSGSPIQFIEWKASFQLLIGKRHVSSTDKLYYLKKYIKGPAQKAIEGIFNRTDEEVYKDACKELVCERL